MEGLHIKEHANKFTKDCSGGTNRKLSYAMSMLGNPKIVLLDEPSTGMDPRSKRFVWDTVLASFQKDRGAILTTHSMEEADALCNRVGIMVKGELRCLGSTQHLKNKYGGGYMLEIKLKHTDTSEEKWIEVEANIKSSFEEATLTESFVDRRTYAIPQSAVSSLASAFTSLEECEYYLSKEFVLICHKLNIYLLVKVRFDIEEYSFGQTTLEQVFIEFAKLQEAANIDDGDIGDNADDETTNNIMKIRRQHSANSSNGNAVNVSDI
jgi:ATP-binding cassette subfamily A (ABC1) protein 5